MRAFYTSVIELRQPFQSSIQTHPFECGWADEAIFFVDVEDNPATSVVNLRVQLSADGIRWLDEGTVLNVERAAFARVTHFGGFLRLAGRATDATGQTVPVTLSVRLALKG